MGRAPCCDKANVKKGPWSPEEDAKLKEYIDKFGTGGNWIALPHKAGLKRCGKSCRLRWLNYLRPNIKHGEFSDDEDRIICSLFATIGSRWSIIAAQLPGRTDNDIKNYWNTKLKKKLMSMSPHNFPPSYNNKHRLLHHHHNPPQRKPFSFHPSSSSSSSLMYSPLYKDSTPQPYLTTPPITNKPLTSFDLPMINNNNISSSPLLQQPSSSLFPSTTTNPSLLQFYNSDPITLVFGSSGGEVASCSSNSDGSNYGQHHHHHQVKQEGCNSLNNGGIYQGYGYGDQEHENNNNNDKFMLSYGGGGYEGSDDHQFGGDVHLEEEVKKLIINGDVDDGSNNNDNGNGNLIMGNVVDEEIKGVEEKVMYYYY